MSFSHLNLLMKTLIQLKNVSADIDFLICDDICVPEKALLIQLIEKILNSEGFRKMA